MKLHICIYNKVTKEIEWPEEYPIDTDEERDWAQKNSARLELQCRLYGGSDWINYYSTDKQFAWEDLK